MLTAARPAHADLQSDILSLLELKGPAYTDCRAKLVEEWRSAPEQHSKERETLRPVLKAVADGIEASVKWPEESEEVKNSFVSVLKRQAAPKESWSERRPRAGYTAKMFEMYAPSLATPESIARVYGSLPVQQPDAPHRSFPGILVLLNQATYPVLRELAVSGLRDSTFTPDLVERLKSCPYTIQAKALVLTYKWESYSAKPHDSQLIVDLALVTSIAESPLFRDRLASWIFDSDDLALASLYKELTLRFPKMAGVSKSVTRKEESGDERDVPVEVRQRVEEILAKDPEGAKRVAAELDAAKGLHVRGVSELPDTPTPSPSPTPSVNPSQRPVAQASEGRFPLGPLLALGASVLSVAVAVTVILRRRKLSYARNSMAALMGGFAFFLSAALVLAISCPVTDDLQSDILHLLELKGPAYTEYRATLVMGWRSSPEQHGRDRDALRPVLKAVADGIEASAKWPEQYDAVKASFVDMFEAFVAPRTGGYGSAKGPPKDGGVRAFDMYRPYLATPEYVALVQRYIEEERAQTPPPTGPVSDGPSRRPIALNEATYPFLREIAVSGFRNGEFSERLAGRLLQCPYAVQSKALLLSHSWETHVNRAHDLALLADLILATDIPESELFRSCLTGWVLDCRDARIAMLYKELTLRFPELEYAVASCYQRDAQGVFRDTRESVMDHVVAVLAKDPSETARAAAELEAAKNLHIRGVSELPDTPPPAPSPSPSPSVPPVSGSPAPGPSSSASPSILLIISIVGALALVGAAIVLLKRRS
ncbi:MAG: hypothetical protein WC712_01040 [Candidatus Brocadiia bacterium]